jgi:hypothetical protein
MTSEIYCYLVSDSLQVSLLTGNTERSEVMIEYQDSNTMQAKSSKDPKYHKYVVLQVRIFMRKGRIGIQDRTLAGGAVFGHVNTIHEFINYVPVRFCVRA